MPVAEGCDIAIRRDAEDPPEQADIAAEGQSRTAICRGKRHRLRANASSVRPNRNDVPAITGHNDAPPDAVEAAIDGSRKADADINVGRDRRARAASERSECASCEEAFHRQIKTSMRAWRPASMSQKIVLEVG